jgi:hypothetical protein
MATINPIQTSDDKGLFPISEKSYTTRLWKAGSLRLVDYKKGQRAKAVCSFIPKVVGKFFAVVASIIFSPLKALYATGYNKLYIPYAKRKFERKLEKTKEVELKTGHVVSHGETSHDAKVLKASRLRAVDHTVEKSLDKKQVKLEDVKKESEILSKAKAYAGRFKKFVKENPDFCGLIVTFSTMCFLVYKIETLNQERLRLESEPVLTSDERFENIALAALGYFHF